MRQPFGMSRGVHDGLGHALRKPKQNKSVEFYPIDDGFEIAYPLVKRNLHIVALR